MFFIFSKILYFLLKPINWVIALMLLALLSKKQQRKRKVLIAAIILSVFFTNRFLFNQVVRLWEVETITADQIKEPFDIGILLGGYSNSHILPRHDRMNFSLRANRFLNAYELYRTGKVKKLLLTGGSGDVLQQQPSEAVLVRDFLVRTGVPAADIILEAGSRNTYENAVNTKKILDGKYAGSSSLLITSAWHQRRAMGCFRKAGVDFVPFSVDCVTEKNRWAPENTLIPDCTGFYLWEFLIKEWVGYIAYWFSGYL
jgi:uncharacterized SAM-binding protein YcdF (DUF218 family)